MANLFKSLKHKADPTHSAFDLSRKHVYSSQAGMCTPCLCVETVPGDKFEIDVTAFMRTQTMDTAAFLRGKQKFDFFFVPYSQLWHPFNQFITQRDDKHSVNQLGHIYCPVVRLDHILWLVYNMINNSISDIHRYNIGVNAIRLLDLLGYGDFRWLIDAQESQVDPTDQIDLYDSKYVNIFRLAAYQHIWYDFYRNKFWDTADVTTVRPDQSYFEDYVGSFNWDDISCTSFANSEIQVVDDPTIANAGRYISLLSLRYAQWKKDIFTSAMPSQQFGAVSTVDISGVNIINDTSTVSAGGGSASVASSNGPTPNYLFRSGDPDSLKWSLPSAFDVLSLRKAEALQQWKQNTLRAGNMTDDNFESHYGVKPYYDADENVHFLGSFEQALAVNAVEATASSSSAGNNRVGDLGANGSAFIKGNKIRFDCKDFGVIMCISTFVPESEYTSNALDKANTLYEQFDFFTPEFQNIGLESIQRFEQHFAGKWDELSDVMGFAPRYYMYKSAVDKVFGEFHDTESISNGDQQIQSLDAHGTLLPWVSPRDDAYKGGTGRVLGDFYITPRVYDNVMSINADANQTTDYLIYNAFFDIKAIRPMSVLGLPQF